MHAKFGHRILVSTHIWDLSGMVNDLREDMLRVPVHSNPMLGIRFARS